MEAVAQAETLYHDAAAHPLATSRAEKHGKDKRYFDLMAYIVSNTISGEIVAVENYSEMVPLMGSTDAKIETVKQAQPALFSMISTSCHSLCAELSVDCGAIGLDSIATDIEKLRVDALDAYMETLDLVGFDHKVTMPLIASMSSYGVQPKADLRLRQDAPPACSTHAGTCC